VADVVDVLVLLDLLELVAGEVVRVLVDNFVPFVRQVGLAPFGCLHVARFWTGDAVLVRLFICT
jgi:hypothetical protein